MLALSEKKVHVCKEKDFVSLSKSEYPRKSLLSFSESSYWVSIFRWALMEFISLCLLFFECIIRDTAELLHLYSGKHKWLEEWKVKPPGTLQQAWLFASSLYSSCGPYTCLAVFFLHPLCMWQALTITDRHIIVFHFALRLLYFIICHPTTPFPKPGLEKKIDFYIKKQICKKLFEINNVGLGLYVSTQF